MRRGLAWLAGAIGIAALARAVRKRSHAHEQVDPADELRVALEESRAVQDEAEPAPVAEPEPADPVPPPADAPEPQPAAAAGAEAEVGAAAGEPLSLEERRRRVHEAAQEAIDSMREPPPAS